MFIFQRDSVSGGGAETEGDTESEASSRLWVISTEPVGGLKLTNRWDHDLGRSLSLNRLSHQGAPINELLKKLN